MQNWANGATGNLEEWQLWSIQSINISVRSAARDTAWSEPVKYQEGRDVQNGNTTQTFLVPLLRISQHGGVMKVSELAVYLTCYYNALSLKSFVKHKRAFIQDQQKSMKTSFRYSFYLMETNNEQLLVPPWNLCFFVHWIFVLLQIYWNFK